VKLKYLLFPDFQQTLLSAAGHDRGGLTAGQAPPGRAG
jgi:hypothetical protein